MAKTKMTKGKGGKAAEGTGDPQASLPGHEEAPHPDVDRVGWVFWKAHLAHEKARKAKKDAEATLLAKMREHGLTAYKAGGRLTLKVKDGKPTVQPKLEGVKGEADEDEE